ncbi:DDHD domain protein [Talaromyces stipitatus ATCC 10500]|uniref:DDHD domain protein n=1 Tax=Talaromyces stipitatus (strain ATCC 10500 / CBS 375.48 / QM 6759 / NRRL 1006) TaxID=441959 RepID=B8MRD9_TALSN|nr:DDHD domain protein [Talaromyces stipitatus ATCC 10500]EED13034.1 DDHD domain protein [Talaromyces stipitatus ATCC 10500]
MSGPVHTYGPTCLRSTPKLDLVAFQSSSDPPPVNSQFFYTSSLPIDDPLTPLPAAATAASGRTAFTPQPFSARDNVALEQAWRALADTASQETRPGISSRKDKARNLGTTSGAGSIASDAGGMPMKRSELFNRHEGPSTWPKKRDTSPLGRKFKSVKRNSASLAGSEGHVSGSEGASSSRIQQGGESTANGQSTDFGTDDITAPATREEVTENATAEVLDTEFSPEEPEDRSARYKIPVGVSRLHLVELPGLKMKPIYWSPLHDISDVLRATWFYKNTMLPIEPYLANELEKGYHYMRAWTDTWQDELNSCVEHGADAEMKVVYKLWQDDFVSRSRPETAQGGKMSTDVSVDDADADIEEVTFAQNLAASGSTKETESGSYKNASVIYVDGKDAQILRPSLLPSVSRNRRPLSSIRKGRQIGIPVVRGFDRKQWDQLHPVKQTNIDMRHYLTRPQTRHSRGEQICYACDIEGSRPNPSDLVLVIHGIGQKLSEKMESFHFTHAINGFRRSVNMELNNEEIWPFIRPDHGGIMVLPVNWRSTLELADAEMDSLDTNDPTANHYTLDDLTPKTIPAIRTLVSDVMLDVPYYLSHHKEKMIRAVVREANRIYRLWCMNNPGFHEHGRVHLLAHSLGSVMALDVLSNQPTNPPSFDLQPAELHDDIFEFDPKNVFLCGSPVGLFLLLNKGKISSPFYLLMLIRPQSELASTTRQK